VREWKVLLELPYWHKLDDTKLEWSIWG